jgi:hypothetical protein
MMTILCIPKYFSDLFLVCNNDEIVPNMMNVRISLSIRNSCSYGWGFVWKFLFIWVGLLIRNNKIITINLRCYPCELNGRNRNFVWNIWYYFKKYFQYVIPLSSLNIYMTFRTTNLVQIALDLLSQLPYV